MASIHLLTGENSYLLRQEKHRWIHEFIKKFGEENCVHMQAQGLTIRNLLDEIAVMPFLSERRLVVIDGIPRASKEEILSIEQNIHPHVILLFVEAKPDKRTAGAKELLVRADVRECKPLSSKELRVWMVQMAKERGVELPMNITEAIVEHTGEDQDTIALELEKLCTYCNKGTLTLKDVDVMIIPSDEGIIWSISDYLSSGKHADALRYARRMLDRGGEAYGLWAVLLAMLKNLISVYAALEAGQKNPKDISDATGVHIFAVRSLSQHARRLHLKDLNVFLRWVAQSDRDLKTGALRSTDEAPQELRALIDRFILACP